MTAKPAVNSMRVAPSPPGENECCGNQCPNCVWLTYSDDLADFEEWERSQRRK
jgi:hypothetical protein